MSSSNLTRLARISDGFRFATTFMFPRYAAFSLIPPGRCRDQVEGSDV